jgi:endoglucanase
MHSLKLLFLGFTALVLAGPVTKKRTSKLEFVGVNESGAEFGSGSLPGVYGTDYTWYNLTTIGTFISQGMNTFRINLLMERLVPNTMTGPMDPNYLGNLTEDVNYITNKGAYAIITPHNYGRYYGNIINSTSDCEAFRKTVAGAFASNSKVLFDTNHEYHDMAGQLVADLNQATINGIRAAGATSQYIAVQGNAYTGAWTWRTAQGTDGLTNAQAMGDLTDPENKILYQVRSELGQVSQHIIDDCVQMHQYLDSDGSGTSSTCVNSTIGSVSKQSTYVAPLQK